MKINYGLHHVDQDDINSVNKSLRSDYLTQGPIIEKFENKLLKKFGNKYCLALSSGTAALHIAGIISNWSNKDKIICSPNTFVASSNSILYSNATPILVDIDNYNYNIDPNLCENILKKKKIKAILVTDYAGHPADWEAFNYLSKKYKVQLINDNCHAIGAKYKNNLNYSTKFSDLVTMSFHPVKNITTGEGGALFLNNKKMYEKAKLLRSHNIVRNKLLNKKFGLWHYDINSLGYNYRLTELQSALGLSQLSKLDMFIKRRTEIANIYNSSFESCENITIPNVNHKVKHAYHLYPLRINFKKFKKNKKKFFLHMINKNIKLQVHYIPIHYHKFYQKKFGYKKNTLPICENFFNEEVSLPIYYSLKSNHIEHIIKSIKNYLYR
jgi:dTDP-4-amino-4,6-dideoxygalactose transaminase